MEAAQSMASAASPPTEVPELSSIYQRHGQFVWVSLQHLGVRPGDVEDTAQEAFIVVHRRLHTFDVSGQMTTCLFGICMRLASNNAAGGDGESNFSRGSASMSPPHCRCRPTNCSFGGKA